MFRAGVTREDVVHQRMLELADELCGGQAAPLLLTFARRQRFTLAELAELRGLIEQLAKQHKRRRNR